MRIVTIFLIFVLLWGFKTFAQSPLSLEFLKDTTPKGKEYIRLIFKADSLFKSRKFQNAIDVYEDAHALKPREVYPRFKAEVIRTLYLPNEIVKNEVKEVQPQEYRFSKKHREKIEKEQAKQLEKEGKKPEIKKDPVLIAENKKKEEKKEVVQEKKEEKKEEKKIIAEVKVENEKKEVKKEEKQEEKKMPVVDAKTKQDANAQLKAIEELKAKEEADEKRKKEEEVQAKEEIEIRMKQVEAKRLEEKKDKPVETNIKKEKEITTISDVIIKKSQDEEIKRIQAEASINTETRPEDEEALLKAKYPQEKSVETIKEKTKTTTQVVINKNGKITVFSKVEHNWGATFYFLKEPGQPIVNISRDYFERNTRDK